MALQSHTESFAFLSLPREIRDLVYTSLLLSETPSLDSHDPYLRCTTTIFPFFQLDTRFIHVPPYVRPNVSNLLASNTQIRRELQAKLSKPGPRCQLKYYLECTVIQDSELFPQWRLVPAPVCYMLDHTFQLDIKLVGGSSTRSRAGAVPSRWMNSAFKVLELIEEFFNRGPTFDRVNVIREDVKVHMVQVNVLQPGNMPKGDISGKPKKKNPTRLPDGSLHPFAMYNMLLGHVYAFKRTLQDRAKKLQICYDEHISEYNI